MSTGSSSSSSESSNSESLPVGSRINSIASPVLYLFFHVSFAEKEDAYEMNR